MNENKEQPVAQSIDTPASKVLADFAKELNRITWEGEDAGWNLAITAVQKRIGQLLAAQAAPATPAPAGKLADEVQYLRNVADDAIKMLAHEWPKTSMLLKDAVAKVSAAAQAPAAPQVATTIKTWQERRKDGCSIERAMLDHIADLQAALQNIVTNASIQPDASMGGATDCYAVPLDDIEHARMIAAVPDARAEAIRIDGEPEESFYRRVVYNNGWNAYRETMLATPATEARATAAEDARDRALAEAEWACQVTINEACDPETSTGAIICRDAIRALRTTSISQAPASGTEGGAPETRDIRNAAGELVGIARKSCEPDEASGTTANQGEQA
jgi:hypothetical protein